MRTRVAWPVARPQPESPWGVYVDGEQIDGQVVVTLVSACNHTLAVSIVHNEIANRFRVVRQRLDMLREWCPEQPTPSFCAACPFAADAPTPQTLRLEA